MNTMTISKEQLTQARVLVVGDVMLDRYWYGAVDRISPEAPVPVVRITREEERCGGAANVAFNAASLGAQARAWALREGSLDAMCDGYQRLYGEAAQSSAARLRDGISA